MNTQEKLFDSYSQFALIPYIFGQQQIQMNLSGYATWLDLLSPSRGEQKTTLTNFKKSEAPALQVVDSQPETLAEPQTEEPLALELTAMSAADDLTVISGIGPGIADKLNQRGITTYVQVAAWTDADVIELEEKIIRFSGRIKREDWIGQAKALIKPQ